jgi:hypothetical protein
MGLVPAIHAARLLPLLKVISQCPVFGAAKPQANDVDGRACPTAVRHGFCLKRRTTLILLDTEGFATHLDTEKDQCRAPSK